MYQTRRQQVWKDSLLAMKKAIESTYRLRTSASEQELFVDAWHPECAGREQDIVFCGYRRNEGWRRMRDITQIIDETIGELDSCDVRSGTALYLQTLRDVALFSKWSKILETSAIEKKSE